MPERPSERFAVAYDRAASSYAEVLDPTLEPVARRIVDLAGVRAGDRLLDVATGTGVVAREADQRGAKVWGIDISPEMIETARRRSPVSITFVNGDAASLPFEDDDFDVVTCGFGLSHMPAVSAVLAEVRRVLCAGGRFVESSWGGDGKNEAFTAILGALDAASEGRLHTFEEILDEDTWADPSRGSSLLSTAGFGVEVVTDRLTGHYQEPSAALAWALAWPDYGETATSLTERERTLFEQSATAAIATSDLAWWFTINYYVATNPAEPSAR